MSFQIQNNNQDPNASTQPTQIFGITQSSSLEQTLPPDVEFQMHSVIVSPPIADLMEKSWVPPENDTLAHYQAIQIPKRKKGRKYQSPPGLLFLLPLLALLELLCLYLFAPSRTNLLLLGIDRAPNGTNVSRSDTIILMTVVPLQPQVGIFSIPRDLWVNIPDVGENRINTAHFFAEANKSGSGPSAVANTIQLNFGVKVPYYVRVTFNGFSKIVDAMGGVTLDLKEPAAGFPVGKVTLNGEQALAFVRDRKGADDFFRMSHGQIMLQAIVGQILLPSTWVRWPSLLTEFGRVVDTNLPVWQWPRLGVAVFRGLFSGMTMKTITREMATPFVTNQGAQVLLPEWDLIRPEIKNMFQN